MEAYAKILGKDFQAFVRTLRVTLGRGRLGPEFIDLGEDPAVSRVQAEVFWDREKKCFVIKNLGRNGIICNKKLLKPGELSELYNKCPIKIGKFCLYFLLPVN